MRDYGKKTRRYRMGGIVPYEDIPQADPGADVESAAREHNYRREREQELPQYRHRAIDTETENRRPEDVHPEDLGTEDGQDT